MLMLLMQLVMHQITVRMRHDVFGILLSFGRMTGLTVIGADHHMNIIAVMLKGIRMGFGSERVAFGASHHNVLQAFWHRGAGNFAANTLHCHGFLRGDHGMTTFLPTADDSRVNRCVAVDTLGTGFAEGYLIRSSKAVN